MDLLKSIRNHRIAMLRRDLEINAHILLNLCVNLPSEKIAHLGVNDHVSVLETEGGHKVSVIAHLDMNDRISVLEKEGGHKMSVKTDKLEFVYSDDEPDGIKIFLGPERVECSKSQAMSLWDYVETEVLVPLKASVDYFQLILTGQQSPRLTPEEQTTLDRTVVELLDEL